MQFCTYQQLLADYDAISNKIRIKPCCMLQNNLYTYDPDYFFNNMEWIFNSSDIYTSNICNDCPIHKDTGAILNINNFEKIQSNFFTNCNIICKFCWRLSVMNKVYNKKAIEYDNNFLNYLLANKKFLYYLSSAAGEQLHNQYFKEEWVFKAAEAGKKKIEIITNGTLLSKEYIDKLVKYREIYKTEYFFDVSIASANKKEFETIEENADFDKVIENALYLNKNKMLNAIYVIRTFFNIDKTEEELALEYKKLGFENCLINFNYNIDFKYNKFFNDTVYKENITNKVIQKRNNFFISNDNNSWLKI